MNIKISKGSLITALICIASAIAYQSAVTIITILRLESDTVSTVFLLINLLLFLAGIFLFLSERKYNIYSFLIIFLMVLIPILCLITGLRYNFANESAIKYILSFGVSCIPATIMGIFFCKIQIKKWHLAVRIITIIIAFSCLTILSYWIRNGYSYDSVYGFDYQSISYLGSYGAVLSVFDLLYYDAINENGGTRKKKSSKIIMFLALLIQAYTVLKGNGRGALLVLLCTLLFFLWKAKIKRDKKIIIVIVVLITFLYFTANGDATRWFMTNRLLRTLYLIISTGTIHQWNTDNRLSLYSAALQSFGKSPIFGHGIGSIFYEIGFYSHNIVLDLLAEIGIVGVSIVVCALIFARCKYRAIKNHELVRNYKDSLIMLLLGACAIELIFSGYYLYCSPLWYAIGYMTQRIYGLHKNDHL